MVASSARRWHAVSIFVLAALAVIAAAIVNGPLLPLGGPGDTQGYEWTGYYLLRNLRFGAWPVLRLVSDQLYYPHGTNAVFQPWGLERDYLVAALTAWFGPGPWIAHYYTASLVIAAVGAYVVSVAEVGPWRAFILGLACSILNFHPMVVEPAQFGNAALHWAELAIIADFIIARRVAEARPLGPSILPGRVLLLAACFGLDLTYVCGFALLSLLLCLVFVASIVARRALETRSETSAWARLRAQAASFRNITAAGRVMLVVAACLSWLYLPLLIQIVRASSSFDFTKIPAGTMWVSVFRLLVPFFPGVHPMARSQEIFGDATGGVGFEGSPGWFLLILGVVGLWRWKGSRLGLVPLIVFGFLCVAYRPEFRTLNVFPWFGFFRVGGRSTSFYPVVLALFAVGFPWEPLTRRGQRGWLVGLALLLGIEVYGVLPVVLSHYPLRPTEPSVIAYMERVGREKGEAILDWPFCASGGNGVGRTLCPSTPEGLPLFSFQRFHGKKVLGGHMGRLHPTQVAPLYEAGWERMLLHTVRPGQPGTCFDSAEWSFFTDFFRLNDFAGINLWTDHLTPECVQEFHRRFGPPTFSVNVAGISTVEFLRRPALFVASVDRVSGRRLKLSDYDRRTAD